MTSTPPELPLILVTNDDGFHAPGIKALASALEPVGRIVVVAPERGISGASHALTLDRPLRVSNSRPERYRVDGTPTDCVHLAVYHLLKDRRPDLVVSGINRGLNIGDDVTYSGTVAGAMEGSLMSIPSIAFSAEGDFEGAASLAPGLCRQVLVRGLPAGLFLNVNVPAGEPRGIRITRQGKRKYRASAEERNDPAGRPYFWIGRNQTVPSDESGDDHKAIENGFVSITPLRADLTDYRFIEQLSEWELEP